MRVGPHSLMGKLKNEKKKTYDGDITFSIIPKRLPEFSKKASRQLGIGKIQSFCLISFGMETWPKGGFGGHSKITEGSSLPHE